MNSLVRNAANTEHALLRASSRVSTSSYASRVPAYRRLASQYPQRTNRDASLLSSSALPSALNSTLRSPFLPSEIRSSLSPLAQTRSLQTTGQRRQEDQAKPKSRPEAEAEAAAKSEEAKTGEAEQKPGEQGGKKAEDGEAGEKSEGGEGKEGEEGKEKKEDLPPPPPHGDKTPWQVFMDTMNTEFQASKEWNESTKQIGAAAHQFSESESVRRAREAYEKSTGAVGGAASHAVKSTATVIGKGAAWTWDTSVVKGVRKAANVTGDAVDKATKPIRETEAYKNVKDVIDDGSSSRYGGWVEKEERKRRRQLQEQKLGRKTEVMEEDIKYVDQALRKIVYFLLTVRQRRHQRHLAQGRRVEGSMERLP